MSKKIETLSELDRKEKTDNEDLKQYREDTAFSPHVIEISDDTPGTSYKVTSALAKQSQVGLSQFIKSLEKYTQKRIEDINLSIALCESIHKDSTSDTATLTKTISPEIENSREDWSDDLVLGFTNFEDHIELEDPGNDLESIIAKSIPGEYFSNLKNGKYLKALAMNEFNNNPPDGSRETYYFKKMDVVKSHIKYLLELSGIKDEIESYINMGIMSGMFVYKRTWGKSSKQILRKVSQKTKGGLLQPAKFQYELKEDRHCRFKAIDPRNLIFRKDGFHFGVVEIIETTISDILACTFDSKGKPLKYPMYDPDRVQGVLELLKKHPRKTEFESSTTDEGSKTEEDTPFTMDDVYELQGDVRIYEASFFPMKINGVVQRTIISAIELDKDKLYTIGIKPDRFNKPIYDSVVFFPKDGDIAGYSIAQKLRWIQKEVDKLSEAQTKSLNAAIKGIRVAIRDVFEDPEVFKNLEDDEVVFIKGAKMQGRSIGDVFSQFLNNIENFNAIENRIQTLQAKIRQTSRKGPTGEKLAPNPTATEAASIFNETQKSVNKVANRICHSLEKFTEDAYALSLMNMEGDLSLKTQGIRLNNTGKKDVNRYSDNEAETSIEVEQIDKFIPVTAEELFVDQLSFKIVGIDKLDKQAVERQQLLQIVNLLAGIGYLTPQPTPDGQIGRKQVSDEAGVNYEVNEYNLLLNIGRAFDIQGLLKKSPATPTTPSPTLQSPGGAGPEQASVSAPTNASLSGSALSQGVSV